MKPDGKPYARDMLEWKSMIRTRSKRDKNIHDNDHIHDDIEELLDLGFSLRIIANLLNVGLTEVMRWKSTMVCRPEEEKKVLELLALCDLLQAKFSIHDPVSWFEKWLSQGCVISMIEIYYNGHMDLVLDFAARRSTAEEVLDAYEPQWRNVPPSMWEVAVNPEGEQYIRMKGDVDG